MKHLRVYAIIFWLKNQKWTMEKTKRNFTRFTTFYFVVILTPGQNNVFSKPNERKRIINWIYSENCRNFTNSTHSDFSLTNSHKVQTQLTNWKIKKKRWKNRKIMSPKNLRTVAREGHYSQHASSSLKFIGTIVGLSATPKKQLQFLWVILRYFSTKLN